MATLSVMVSRILDELNRTDLTAQATLAVKSAIEAYANESWGFNETQTAIPCVINQYAYTLPSDFRHEIFIGVDYLNRRYRCDKQDYACWQGRFDPTVKGVPDEFVIFSDQINLYPIPDRSLTLRLSYVQTLPELSDAGSNGYTNELEEMIRMRAEGDLLANVIRGQEALQESQLKAQRERDAYLRARYRRVKTTTNGLKRSGL
jgi:hypothetical protein